jgi:hypothetical protein
MAGLSFLYLWHYSPTPRQLANRWGLWAALTGLAGLSLGGAPFWATQLPITLAFPWDRFMLAFAFGSSILLAGLISLVRWRRLQVSALVVLISLAVGFHIYNGTSYRREWAAQRAFFWQLAWRAPALQPGTMVMSADLPFTYFSDNSLTAPLNWLYAPGLDSADMPYLFYNIESRQDKKLPNLKPGVDVQMPYRKASFEGNTSQALAVFYEPPGCVIVANPAMHAALPQKPRYFSDVLPLSNPELIQIAAMQEAKSALPPEHIFGPEPAPDWCFYFEKADLARQAGDWAQVTALAEPAFALQTRLYEVNAPELVTYIEGFARTGQWQRAFELTRQAYRLAFRMERMLCQNWKRILGDFPSDAQALEVSLQVSELLGCTVSP